MNIIFITRNSVLILGIKILYRGIKKVLKSIKYKKVLLKPYPKYYNKYSNIITNNISIKV